MLELLLALFLLTPRSLEREEFELESLSTPASTRSAFPNLAQGADGQVYLSWIERDAEQLGTMKLSVLKQDSWSEPVEVTHGSDLFLNWADFPSVCALQDGTLIAHWLRHGEDTRGYNAEFSISTDGGERWSVAKRIHDDQSGVEHGFISMVALDEDSFGAIWLDGRASVGQAHGAGETALYYRTISATGELGDEVVLDPRVCDCCQTSLVANSKGELFATYRDRSPKEVRDISIVQYDGEAWSAPKCVHPDEWLIDGCPVNGPRVTNVEGLTAVAWFTGQGGGGGSVRLAFRKGDWYGAPIDIDEGRPVGRVDLLFLDGNSALVSWMEYAADGKADWRVRSVTQGGKMGASIKVGRVPSDRSSGYLRMVHGHGGVILSWTIPGTDGRIETARLRLRK